MSSTSFKVLTEPLNYEGEDRRVGFELEFSGLTLEQTVHILQQELPGRVVSASKAEQEIEVDGLGSFKVEIDWDYLKRKAKAEGGDKSAWVRELGNLAENLVPIEIVCPPLTLKQCEQLLPLIDALREAGAKGTDESWIAAYGVHINPEVPSLDANVVLRYLQAFSLLQWWLVEAHCVDTTRKLSPYIDKYPEAYTRLLAKQHSVNQEQLISDYLKHNATRNRALDMLPLFAFLDEEKVMSTVDDNKIKARPTFHYRLPNCQLEHPDWQLTEPWKMWWVVDALANDQQALDYWKQAFIDAERPLIGVSEKDWKERLEQWLKDREWL
ncbi:amidoligase family protein [Idiomarina sp. HP20-50]|uniref:amidoligase family protein n=1 Tax=Idiomarina sp. HP20-50 TaxID=3070813 RepID=UPI00294AF1B2|nr:amidoligase family protein [Idiomarina sp. HP20-50]MDV6316900.1 amidoligase family protein [Idiomarina sp. HP20-50]